MFMVELQAGPAVNFIVSQLGPVPNVVGYDIPDVLHGNDALHETQVYPVIVKSCILYVYDGQMTSCDVGCII